MSKWDNLRKEVILFQNIAIIECLDVQGQIIEQNGANFVWEWKEQVEETNLRSTLFAGSFSLSWLGF